MPAEIVLGAAEPGIRVNPYFLLRWLKVQSDLWQNKEITSNNINKDKTGGSTLNFFLI